MFPQIPSYTGIQICIWVDIILELNVISLLLIKIYQSKSSIRFFWDKNISNLCTKMKKNNIACQQQIKLLYILVISKTRKKNASIY